MPPNQQDVAKRLRHRLKICVYRFHDCVKLIDTHCGPKWQARFPILTTSMAELHYVYQILTA